MYRISIRFAKIQGEEEGRTEEEEAGGGREEDGMILKREPTHKECGGKKLGFGFPFEFHFGGFWGPLGLKLGILGAKIRKKGGLQNGLKKWEVF